MTKDREKKFVRKTGKSKGGWAGKPGVAGTASEYPLEGVESNEVRTRGRLPPP